MDQEAADFFEMHAAGGPTHVVLVSVLLASGGFRVEVFSTIQLANAWIETLDESKHGPAVLSPHIIDFPEFGNIPKHERQ